MSRLVRILTEESSLRRSMSKTVDLLTDSIRAAVGTSYISRGVTSTSGNDQDLRLGGRLTCTSTPAPLHRQTREHADCRPQSADRSPGQGSGQGICRDAGELGGLASSDALEVEVATDLGTIEAQTDVTSASLECGGELAARQW